MPRIATWNCNMAFRKKKYRILNHDPDILVIQECENPEKTGEWSEFSDWQWVGDNEDKGLGVFCRNGIKIDRTIENDSNSRFVLPVETTGSVDVFGVWAMNDEDEPRRRYIGQVYTSLQHYKDFVDENTVVAGDFNWNVMWDESPKSPLHGNFTETVEILNEIGLYSSYHRVVDSEFGEETDPTFFMHKKEKRDYHTDYLFVPSEKSDSITEFYIGSYEDWSDASDHMPLLVEIP